MVASRGRQAQVLAASQTGTGVWKMYELPVRHKAGDPDGEFCLHLLQADWVPLWLELIQMMPHAEILEDRPTAYNPMLDRSGLSESHRILTRGTHVGNLPRGFSGSLGILPMVGEKRKHLET